MFKDMHLDLCIDLVFNITSWVMHAGITLLANFCVIFARPVCNFSNSGGHSNSNSSVDLSTQSSCKYM